jgi:hypothetical protein
MKIILIYNFISREADIPFFDTLVEKHKLIFKISKNISEAKDSEIIFYHDTSIEEHDEFKSFESRKWIIKFGGGPDKPIALNDKKYGILPYKNFKDNLDGFLANISSKATVAKDDFNILFEYDPLKEASIYLWKSLSTLGRKMKKSIDFKAEIESLKKDSRIKIIEQKLQKFEDEKSFDANMKQLKEELFSQPTQLK